MWLSKYQSKFRQIARLRGLLLIEVIVVIALLAIIGSTILLLMTSQLSNVSNSKKSSQALLLAEEGMEAARMIRDADWDSLAIGNHGLDYLGGQWTFLSTSDTADGFTRMVTVTEIAANERQVNVDIMWESEGRQLAYELSSVLSNWRNVVDEGSGGGGLSGDWSNPSLLGNTIDLGWGDRGMASDITSSTLYLAMNGFFWFWADLFILDVSDPDNVVVHDSIDIGSGCDEISVNEDQTYAFCANESGSNSLQIVDVSDWDDISLAKSYNLSENNGDGLSVEIVGTDLMFGTESDGGNEFFIIDVSNVSSPSVRNSLEIGSDVNDIYVQGNYAYLATSHDNHELVIVDISDPDNPTIVSSFNLSGNNNGLAVYMNPVDDRVYVGRKEASGGSTPEVVIVDVSTPSTPNVLGSLEYAGDIRGVFAAENLMFFVADTGEEFQAYDVTALPTLTYYSGIDFESSYIPTDVTFENNVFYVTIWWSKALRVITAY